MPAGPPLAAPAALPVSASLASNFGYAVAVAGALLTVFAFFALPYVTATFTTTNQDPTLCGDNACTTTSVTLPAIRSLDGTGVLIVVVILAALTAAIGLFPALRNGVSSLLSPRAAARFVVAAGIAGLVGMLEQYIVVQATILQIAGGADRILQLFGASFSSTVVMQPGFWLMALGTSVIFLGGFIARRGLPPSITPMAPTGSPPIAPPWP